MTTSGSQVAANRTRVFAQIAAVLFYFTFFYDAALRFRGFINLSPAIGIGIAVVLNAGTLFFAAAAMYRYAKSRKFARPASALAKLIRENLAFLLVVALFTVLALLQFDHIARYDAGLYYSPLITATETFTFDFSSLFSSFGLSLHPTQGFAFLIGAGEMLFPKQNVGVYTVSLVLTIAGLFCLYEILGRILPQSSRLSRAAGTAVFAFCPYVLGLFSYTTPDYYLTVFLILMIWAFEREYHLLCAFASLLICFSKEPGILWAAAFLLSAFAVRVARQPGKGFFRKFWKYMWPKKLLLYGFVPAFYLFFFKFYGTMNFATSVTNESPLRWDSNGIHCFGFLVPYISARLMQLLVYNFFWLSFLPGCIAILVLLVRSRRAAHAAPAEVKSDTASSGRTDFPDVASAVGLGVSSFVYLIFSCLFITHLCPRYAVCFALPAAFVSVWAVSILTRRKILSGAILALTIVLLLGQNYMEIDPTVNLTCRGLPTGRSVIYSPTTSWNEIRFNLDLVSEMYAHNRIYAFEDDLGARMFSILDLKKDDVTVYVGLDYFELYLFGDPVQTDHLIYWDPATGRRTYEDNIEGAFVPKYQVLPADAMSGDGNLKLPDHFYFFVTAHTPSSYVDDIRRRGYGVSESYTVDNFYGSITVYAFEKTA